MKRRRPSRGFLAVLLVGLGLALWALWIEPASLTVHAERLDLPRWPRALAGLRVAALSDIHTGAPHVGLDDVAEVVKRTNELRPDVTVLLGDYVIHEVVAGRFVSPERTAKVLGRLHAELGVFAVLGNHDGWLDAFRVRRALERAGIPVVENDVRRLARRGQPFWIAGLEDEWTGMPRIERTLEKVTDDAPILLLTHGPDVFPRVPARVSLTLAGHTHGGQVRLPFVGPPMVPSRYDQRYAAGHVVERGRHLFVTTGIGTSIFPVRLGVPPEILLLTLR